MKVHLNSDDGKREIDIHIEDSDVKSLDNTLSLIIYPVLLSFREKVKIAPVTMYPSDVAPYKLKGESEDDYDSRLTLAENEALEAWKKALDSMLFSFKQVTHGDPTWEYDALQKKRVQDGLDLFAKHFRSLWL